MSSGVTAHPYRDFELAGWESAAAAYAETFEAATRLFADELLAAVEVGAGIKLLDVACGTGYLAQLALDRGARVTGADFSVAMLSEARRLHPSVHFEQADAEALPYPDCGFDAVTINFGLHHFPFPARALAEARRVLHGDGRIAFTVWATPDQHALHAIALEAVRSAGSVGASLPTPTHGGLNTLDGCIGLLATADFMPVAERCGLVRRRLRLASIAELTHLIDSGTVRLASLLRSQPAESRQAILQGLEAAAARYLCAGQLEIPVVAVIVTGTAAPRSREVS